MSKFARGIKSGKSKARTNNWLCWVNRKSTGPHLHYEVIVTEKSKFTKIKAPIRKSFER